MGFIERLKQLKENEAKEKQDAENESRSLKERHRTTAQQEEIRMEFSVEESRKHLEESGLPELLNKLADIIGGEVGEGRIYKNSPYHQYSYCMFLEWDRTFDYDLSMGKYKNACKKIYVLANREGAIKILSWGGKSFSASSVELVQSPKDAEESLGACYSSAKLQKFPAPTNPFPHGGF